MSRYLASLVIITLPLLCAAETPDAKVAPKPPEPIYGTLETTLATLSPQIRMFALDGDPNTYFASKDEAKATDHFTLVLDKPVALKSVSVVTGRVKETDLLDKGTLQISADGKTFEDLEKFAADGSVKADAKGVKVLAIRLKPSEDLKHPLAVREFTIESDPPVAIFKHPVEVFTVCDDDPTLKEWTEKTARVCERQYQMICEELKSDGFNPKTVCTMTLKNDKGVAYTSGSRIVGHVGYFKTHQSDVGAMVHEMVHFGQAYGGRRGGKPNPGWLVEGIADYIRCYKYEGGKLRRVNPDTAKYDQSYQITAHFVHYVAEKYDKNLVNKLNKVMREGKYSEEIWKELTQKTLEELGQEWKDSLKKPA